jgi:integrative and conjugative element protein (TIGR02256 family)
MRLPWRSPSGSVRALGTALEDARRLAGAALPRETGGILLGYRRHGEVVVQCFLEVADEEAGPTRYRRRHEPAQAALDHELALQPPGSALGYVGEWHSHPGKAGPNRRDVRELGQSARQTRYPVALVVLFFDGASWTPLAWTAVGRRTRAARVIEVRDDGESIEGQDEP